MNKTAEKTFYIVSEAQKLSGDHIDDWRDLMPYGHIFPSRKAALRGLEKMVREIVEAEYEGLDEKELTEMGIDIGEKVREIVARGDGKPMSTWHWDSDCRIVTWRLFRQKI